MNALLPLKYLLPTPSGLIGQQAPLTEGYGKSSPARQTRLERLINAVESNSLSEPRWIEFLEDLIVYNKETFGELKIRDGWHIFSSALRNPISRHRQYLLSNSDFTDFPSIDPQYIYLVQDVLRDGRITESEKVFLLEKANDYNISKHDRSRLINHIRTTNIPFIRLVDEICSDGIVTTNERALIEERARDCNIRPSQVQTFISLFLALHGLVLTEEPHAPGTMLVPAYFLYRYVLGQTDRARQALQYANQILSTMGATDNDNDNDNDEIIALCTQTVGAELRDSLSTHIGFPISKGPTDLSAILLQVGDLEIPGMPPTPTPTPPSPEDEARPSIQYQGVTFHVELVSLRHLPLFSHDTRGADVFVSVNTEHPLIANGSHETVNVAIDFALSLTMARIGQYTKEAHLDRYFREFDGTATALSREPNRS